MLKKLVDPLLALLAIGAGLFFFVSCNAASPLADYESTPAPTTTASEQRIVPLGTTPTPSDGAPQDETSPHDWVPDVDVMLVIDNSGSMHGVYCDSGERIPGGGNDPREDRIRAAETFIAALAADIEPRGTNLGVVSIGNTTNVVIPLTWISSNQEHDMVRNRLAETIKNPECGGQTDIVSALKLARQQLNNAHETISDHRDSNIPVIVLLTDGAPTTGNEPDWDQLSEIRSLVQQFEEEGYLIYSILLGNDPNLKQFEDFWRQEVQKHPATVRIFTPTRSEEMEVIYAEIRSELDNRNHAPPGCEMIQGTSTDYEIPENVDKVVFTVRKPGGDTPVALKTPSGEDPEEYILLRTDSAAIDVFVVKRPEAGRWVVESENGQKITLFCPDLASIYMVELLRPDRNTPLLADQSSEVVVQVVDKDDPSRVLPGDFTIRGGYRPKDALPKDDIPFEMQPVGEHQYRVEFPAGTFADLQTYRFWFEGNDSIGLKINRTEYEVEAGKMPALIEVTAPKQLYVGEEARLRAEVANIESVQGNTTPRIDRAPPKETQLTFTPQGSGIFQASMGPLERPGEYTIHVLYQGETTFGIPFQDARTRTIEVVEPWWAVWLRNLALMVAILAAGYLVYRYILIPYTPLVAILQRIGVSPRGYFKIVPPGSPGYVPDAPRNIGEELRKNRRALRLTFGTGKDCDISLEEKLPDDRLGEDETSSRATKEPPFKRAWELVWGKPAWGVIRREINGATLLYNERGVPSRFAEDYKETEIRGNMIQYALERF
jgi:uncharacterized protein YegL